MPDDQPDVGRFFKEAETFCLGFTTARGLGIALGNWKHPVHGMMRVLALYGRAGNGHVTMACCATDEWLAQGRIRLWRYDDRQPMQFDFKDVALRTPASETIV